jgi:hypothetical protein
MALFVSDFLAKKNNIFLNHFSKKNHFSLRNKKLFSTALFKIDIKKKSQTICKVKSRKENRHFFKISTMKKNIFLKLQKAPKRI